MQRWSSTDQSVTYRSPGSSFGEDIREEIEKLAKKISDIPQSVTPSEQWNYDAFTN